ncbi:MAG TPA: ABC transporter permease [Chloroflexota bacterium]|jgi:NitT/TauT family transport system permease protein|nr:ABC transporter permease [Chloroflexota bacterium]
MSVVASAPPDASTTARYREERAARLDRATVERLLSILSPILLLALWELLAQVHVIDTRFFPAPSSIFAVFLQMLQPTPQFPSSELWQHLSISLTRIAIGFLIGAVPAILVGVAMGLFSPIRAIVQPLIDATFPIPKIAILPLFIMIFGIGEESKYAIIATAVFFLVLINTVSGVRNIDSIYLDVAKNFHASQVMRFTDIALPGALPMIVTGLKLGMGVALLVIVSAEFVGAKSGIGYLIWTSWQIFQVEKMYVGLLVIAVVGFVTAIFLNWVERTIVPWKRL